MHGWFNYVMYCLRLSEIVTLSGDQNEVFESLVDFQRLISWNPSIENLSFIMFMKFGLQIANLHVWSRKPTELLD